MRRALVALGVGLGLLGSTVVAAPAQAASPVRTSLASTASSAQEAATFWLADGGANLKNATPYAVQTVVHGERVSTPIVPDGEPGQVPPLPSQVPPDGETPTTWGKVFFIGADGQPHWCTGTAMTSSFHNVVATAGHCVYDTQSSAVTLDKWVFVPGYSEGATPWSLYVGKYAFVHDDFDAYTDYDRDFAFVNVYKGVISSSTGALTSIGNLVDNVGGQGFAYNRTTGSSTDVFGYPAGPNPDGTQPPYTGQVLERSTGPTFAMTLSDLPADRFIGVDSPFPGEGSLGSSWLLDYGDSENGAGYLNGITIGVSDTDGDNRYDTSVSPYFDSEVYAVYRATFGYWTGPIV
ncbi:trypsin-like serine peptidase [Microtetraspora malaysiensis]|uniref:trypsin-like serine peptidase n=1 Tax=Microtetraspora malaysiensis TaxID=161358 RepID=UPI00082AB9A8|nr:trypsin-like serine protease [Microtetraspora malaysiensis]